MPTKQRQTAPYVPFKTFLSAIESLGPPTPHSIDRSLWPSFSGGITGQLLSAFRFFQLIDENGAPKQELALLVEQPAERKGVFQGLMKRAYEDVISIGLLKASPKQLDDALEGYGVSGATHRKAVSFFLQAARYCELPLSQHLSRQTRSRTRRKAGKFRNGDAAKDAIATTDFSAPQRTHRTIRLRSGEGSVTLEVTFDAFTISPEDREFVFKTLIDQLIAYERQGQRSEVGPELPAENQDEPPRIGDEDVPF
ncbi:MAG: hypothetical protein ACRD3T_14695 [Terriglobia bacterium]